LAVSRAAGAATTTAAIVYRYTRAAAAAPPIRAAVASCLRRLRPWLAALRVRLAALCVVGCCKWKPELKALVQPSALEY